MKRNPYAYSILRFFHDITAGEFVNVGVAVYSNETGELIFKIRPSLGRFGDILDDNKAANFRSLIKLTKDRAELVSHSPTNLDLGNQYKSLGDALRDIFPNDDSALQWSEVHFGLSYNLEETATRLYTRFCGKYDRKSQQTGRVVDNDAWTSFRRKLSERNMLGYFEPKVIQSGGDEIAFPFAWKNGIWHCIEPISLDLAREEQIRAKAHKCVGEIVGIRDAIEDFAVYYVVSKPKSHELDGVFKKALKILKDNPFKTVEVFEEGQETPLLEKLTAQIEKHPQ